jgi:hypothetical protein
MTEVILVPRRDDNGHRDALWDGLVKPWWERHQSHMPIIEGHHTEGLFNRSAAVNRAAEIAGDWDVAVIIDSDVICHPGRVKEAVKIARSSGKMVLPHTVRYDLTWPATIDVQAGRLDPFAIDVPNLRKPRRFIQNTYSVENGHPSISSVVVISRRQWDEVGGFDEQFRGWGYEDTAFAAACETFGGIERLEGEVWHFWHPTAKEGKRGSYTWSANSARGQRYRAAIGDPVAIRALQASGRRAAPTSAGIPRILHRTVPASVLQAQERSWATFEELHPGWTLMTHRDPLVHEEWPLTSPYWELCETPAQFADLIRLEALTRWGGVYVDSDCDALKPLDPLLSVPAFAAWEDERVIPNAVLGAVKGHPAIRACLDMMIAMLPCPTWESGPGVTTALLPNRPDVLVLPPGAFYPVHYRDPERAAKMDDPELRKRNPWAFILHRYAGSWLKTTAA